MTSWPADTGDASVKLIAVSPLANLSMLATPTDTPSAFTVNSCASGLAKLGSRPASNAKVTAAPSTVALDSDGHANAVGSVRNVAVACAAAPSGSVAVIVITV